MTVSETTLTVEEKEYPVRLEKKDLVCELLERGRYDEIDPWLTVSNDFVIPVSPLDLEHASSPCKLVQFKEHFPIDRQRIILARQGFQPVTLAVLLAFGGKYPEAQTATQITTYSAYWWSEAFQKFPFLGMLNNKRYFGACYPSELNLNARILCISKQIP